MSQFVEVNTAELIGAALDWAVAQVESEKYIAKHITKTSLNLAGLVVAVEHAANYRPSTDWAQGGQLRDKYKVDITELDTGVLASICTESCECIESRGPTALIALCRAIVATKLGDVVQVPAELAGVAS